MPRLRSALERLAPVRDDEVAPVLLAALGFFLILGAYFMIKPLRDTFGVERGMGDLRWLFLATLVVMVFANAAFGFVVARIARRFVVGAVYRFIIVCLVVFAMLLFVFPDAVGVNTGYVFFVWLSVANMFMTSLFWVTIADGFTLEQAKRLFPIMAVGGTLGAIAGSWFNERFAEGLDPIWYFVVSIVMLELGVWCLWFLRRQYTRRGWRGESPPERSSGGAWQGMLLVLRDRYLLGISAYIFLVAVGATLIYFATREIVVETTMDAGERQRLFGTIYLYTQILTLAVQLFVTGRLMRVLGVALVMCVLPAVTVIGFGVLAVFPLFIVGAWFEAAFNACKYAVGRPVRETLYTVVGDDERLKAKPFIDTFVYRGGDAAGVAVDAGTDGLTRLLAGLGGGAVAPIAGVAAIISFGWAGVGLWLGRKQSRLAVERDQDPVAGAPG